MTTPTAALQVLTGLQLLRLQIQKEATYARVALEGSSSNFFIVIFIPTDYESKSSGIHIHPHNFLLHNQISLSENHRLRSQGYYGPRESTLLLSHKHIHLRWLKAHVGYYGNECADQLAKETITKCGPFFLPKQLSYLKFEIRSAALSIWQNNWDNGETSRSTHDIMPRVSNKPVGWNREELMLVTGHGPFT
ncbi:hypothetical protein AVEN_94373-1 [Araneus ventricosus]|uniref:Uncharacterized protein n=1 Tax=Araneus ventricosus TaxID=182803 RepID=A0A4Y2EA28_ARAVE|nr:hypothetical protein AVEN_94373-1 [Araneus ventricosus]